MKIRWLYLKALAWMADASCAVLYRAGRFIHARFYEPWRREIAAMTYGRGIPSIPRHHLSARVWPAYCHLTEQRLYAAERKLLDPLMELPKKIIGDRVAKGRGLVFHGGWDRAVMRFSAERYGTDGKAWEKEICSGAVDKLVGYPRLSW